MSAQFQTVLNMSVNFFTSNALRNNNNDSSIPNLLSSSGAIFDAVFGAFFDVLDGSTRALCSLLPDLKPKSVSEVITQLKKEGNALASTKESYTILELLKNKQGRFAFRAINEKMHPVVIQEGKSRDSRKLWEAAVSEYLVKKISQMEMIEYGKIGRRWKGEKFEDLKKDLNLQGMLREQQGNVVLNLPDDSERVFKGDHAHQKADLYLKRYYQFAQTPQEEVNDEKWRFFGGLFIGYLSLSGPLLASWGQSHQLAELEQKRALQLVQDNFLSTDELIEMARSPSLQAKVIELAEVRAENGMGDIADQLRNVQWQSRGFSRSYEYEGTSFTDKFHFDDQSDTYSRLVEDQERKFEFTTVKSDARMTLTKREHFDDGSSFVQKATYHQQGDEFVLIDQKEFKDLPIVRLHSIEAPAAPKEGFVEGILSRYHAQPVVINAATAYLASLATGHKEHASLHALGSAFLSLIRGADAYPVSDIHSVEETRLDQNATSRFTRHRIQKRDVSVLNPLITEDLNSGQSLNLEIDVLETFQDASNPDGNLLISAQTANNSSLPNWLSFKSSAPQLSSTFYLNNIVTDLFIQGDYAYLATSRGLSIVNISIDSQPILVSELNSLGNCIYIKVAGDYAYLGSSTFTSVDISDPANPKIMSRNSINANDLEIQGDYAFLVGGGLVGSDDIKIFDISNPSNMQQVAGIYQGLSSPLIKVDGNYIYLTGHSNNAQLLFIYDITNPKNPTLKSSLTTQLDVPLDIDVNGDYACIAQTYNGLLLINISNKNNPFIEGVPLRSLQLTAVSILGNLVYAYDKNTIRVINLNSPSNPVVEAASANILSDGTNVKLDLKGNTLFVAERASGYKSVDVAKRVLSGRPSSSDRGLQLLDVVAKDSGGHEAVAKLPINVGSIAVNSIPKQTVYVGSSLLFTLDPNTFDYPNSPFTYTATLIGGMSLPDWLQFDPLTLTFHGTPFSGDQNVYQIQVKADNGYGKTVTASFNIEVPDRPPLLENPLGNQTAYTGQFFEYAFPADTFVDLDLDTISYRARLVGSEVLPGWLALDSALRRFYGTPFGFANYQIELIAEDGYGGKATAQFSITVPNSPPIVLNPIDSKLASVGIEFRATINTNTFYDVDGQTLSLSASSSSGPLPNWLSFDPATRTFSGLPTMGGTLAVVVTAVDPFGEKVSTRFDITVLSSSNNNPPLVNREIPDQKVNAGEYFSYTFSANTFTDPDGSDDLLRYEVALESGDPIPAWMLFDSATRTFSGTPPEPQSLRISVRAYDPLGAFAIDTFSFAVVDSTNYPPIVLNPLLDGVAEVDKPFVYPIPANTFFDANGDELEISVYLAGGLPLPGWLRWDPVKKDLSGTPDWFDTDAFASRTYKIEVFARDGTGSAKTTFDLFVTGESFWAFFLKTSLTVGSVGISLFGAIQKRHLIWNYFLTKKYRKATERTVVNERYERAITIDEARIKEVRAFQNNHPLAQGELLPKGLSYTDNRLEGTPTKPGKYTIRFIGKDGRYLEEFVLMIKESADAPDPLDPQSDDLIAKCRNCLPSLSPRPTEDSDQEEELSTGRFERWFGKIQFPNSFPLRSHRQSELNEGLLSSDV